MIKKWATLWFLALGMALGAQDDEKIRQLVENLSNDRIEVRKAAVRSLVEIGEKAILALEKAAESTDAEIRALASAALKEVRRNVKLSEIMKEVKPFDVRLENTDLYAALNKISEKSGIKFDASGINGKEKVSLNLSGVTLMKALDSLCEQAPDFQWSFFNQDSVFFGRNPYIPKLAIYSGGFKIALRKLQTYRSSDFLNEDGVVNINLQAQTEPGIHTFGAPDFQITTMVDEDGKWLPVSQNFATLYPFRTEILGPMDSSQFAFGNLNKKSGKLTRVGGSVTFYFAVEKEEVILKDLVDYQESTTTVGDVTVTTNLYCPGMLQITLKPRSEKAIPERFVDTDSIVIVDADGKEQAIAKRSLTGPNRSGDNLTFYCYFDNSAQTTARSARFKVNTEIYEHKIPFEFKDVPLP